MDDQTTTEDVEAFRLRARQWLAEIMPLLPEGRNNAQLVAEDEMGERARHLQGLLFEGGFAGLCFPTEYGGRGLTRTHQKVFTEESPPYQMPTLFNVPTLSIWPPPCSTSAPRSRSADISRPSSAARSCGCSSCPSPAAVPTWPAW